MCGATNMNLLTINGRLNRRPVTARMILYLCTAVMIGCESPSMNQQDSSRQAAAEAALADGVNAYQSGNFELAIDHWQRADRLYAAAGIESGQIDAKRNRATALRALGMFQMAVDSLQSAMGVAQRLGDHGRMTSVKNDLGALLTLTRQLPMARSHLEQALAMAMEDGNLPATVSILNNLGNLYSVEGLHDQSLQTYRRSAELAKENGLPWQAVRALVNAASAGVAMGHDTQAHQISQEAMTMLVDLPDCHDKASLLLSVASHEESVANSESPKGDVAMGHSRDAYEAAIRVARRIQDDRSLSYGLGGLGHWHELQGNVEQGLRRSEEAIVAAGRVRSHDTLYQWHWQMGRLQVSAGQRDLALVSYRRAIDTLELIRYDVAVGYGNRESSFRQEVGQLFFELADILLKRAGGQVDPQKRREDLLQARQTIEQFKTAELVDYFQDECVGLLEAKEAEIDEVSMTTAVIYPIALPDRLELLVSFHDQLKRYKIDVPRDQLVQEVNLFRGELQRLSTRQYLQGAQQLYRWLIAPIETDLHAREIDTLVFVPDGPLRLVPIAAFHDGEKFLIQRFATAITPGLTLTDPKSLGSGSGNLLACGLSLPQQTGFMPLPHVPDELNQITQLFTGTKLLDEAFSLRRIRKRNGPTSLFCGPYCVSRQVWQLSAGDVDLDP